MTRSLISFFILATPISVGARTQQGLASVYWPGDGHSGPVCADGKPFTKKRCHIAHRSWPLGRRVRVCSIRNKKLHKCVISFVGDRGPFGACDEKGRHPRTHACRGTWMLKIRRDDPGTWRGVADLSRCVAKSIQHPGLHTVRVTLLSKNNKLPLVQWPEPYPMVATILNIPRLLDAFIDKLVPLAVATNN